MFTNVCSCFVSGYRIEEGSLLFLNNYDLSMSKELWDEPAKFKPERFLKDGKLVKPEHFLPFGGGRRSCLGYRMVQLISFGILGGCLQTFNVTPVEKEMYKIPIGALALKKDTFKFKFVRRWVLRLDASNVVKSFEEDHRNEFIYYVILNVEDYDVVQLRKNSDVK